MQGGAQSSKVSGKRTPQVTRWQAGTMIRASYFSETNTARQGRGAYDHSKRISSVNTFHCAADSSRIQTLSMAPQQHLIPHSIKESSTLELQEALIQRSRKFRS